MFTLVVGSSPKAFAEEEYPENIDLTFVKGSNEDNLTLTNEGKTADYDIASTSQTVSLQLRISLNKKYEAGQLRIVIPSLFTTLSNRLIRRRSIRTCLTGTASFTVSTSRLQKRNSRR